MEQDQPLFSQPQQIDYSTLLSIIKQELKKFSLSNQTFSYQTACRYGPKDHDILAFQVRVLQKILDNIPHDQLAHRSLAELQVKNLALEENMGILKSELNSATSKNAKLGVQLQEAHAAIADKDKKLTSLMRKCDQFDRLGGKQKFDKLDQEFRQITGKLASLQLSEKKASEKLAELQRQIKLQKELNSQQETAIVDLQIQNEGLKERLETIEKSKKHKETTLKENVQSFSNGAKVSDMELLSLKQKIKEQSQLIDSLRSQFETAKSHWLKKQQHYSKVVEKCFMKEQLL